jgi:hypothetical protein
MNGGHEEEDEDGKSNTLRRASELDQRNYFFLFCPQNLFVQTGTSLIDEQTFLSM